MPRTKTRDLFDGDFIEQHRKMLQYRRDQKYKRLVKILTGWMIVLVGIWQFTALPSIPTFTILLVFILFAYIVMTRERAR